MSTSHDPRSATARKLCPRCGPTPRRCDTWTAVGLVGILVGVLAGVAHTFVLTGTQPRPAGLYVAALGSAVAALWLIARAFRGQHC